MIEKLRTYKWPIFAGVLIFLGYLWYSQSSLRHTPNAAAGIERFPYPTDRIQESRNEYILADVQSGKVDLALELVRLRRDCAGELDEQACNDHIRKLIAGLSARDNQRLLEIFEQYLQFETKMRASIPENFARLSDREKYALMKKARRDFFGEETARLIFGVEEARIALQEEQAKFAAPEYANLPAHERLQLYEDRKKEIMGTYYQSTIEREPPDIKFGTEMMLQQTELAKMPEAERKRTVSEMRVKYFGAVQAARMDHEEKVQTAALSESLGKMDQFLAAEKDYLKNNPGLSDEARRAGVEDLRRRILGN
jgi:hypothetical protein